MLKRNPRPKPTGYTTVDDAYDTRIPLHNEEAFKHGINFRAKVSLSRHTELYETSHTWDSAWTSREMATGVAFW
jgi:hypothetical protein